MALMKNHAPAFDWLTVLAIGMTVYLIKNVVHEGFGHGLACLIIGGQPVAISSAWWDGTYEGVSDWGRRGVMAAGTFANLALGLLLIPLWRTVKGSPHLSLFLWLLIVVNLFNGAGYLMADPIGNFGDWSSFLKGLDHQVPLRIVLFGFGLGASKSTLRFGLKTIERFVGGAETERSRRARWICWGPYLVGGTSFTLAGLLNPLGKMFAVTSALATFGGAAFLAYLPTQLKPPPPSSREIPVSIERSLPWLVIGASALLLLFVVLAPSIQF